MRKQTCIPALLSAGISWDDAHALRRISMTLTNWATLECGDGNNYQSWAIERDDETGKPYMATYPHDAKAYRTPIADREKGALKRLDKIMQKYPTLKTYHQTDPRGAALYIIRPGDVREGADVGCCYNNGIAVYK